MVAGRNTILETMLLKCIIKILFLKYLCVSVTQQSLCVHVYHTLLQTIYRKILSLKSVTIPHIKSQYHYH